MNKTWLSSMSYLCNKNKRMRSLESSRLGIGQYKTVCFTQGMAGTSVMLPLLAVVVGIALSTAERPCGDFKLTPNIRKLVCDYKYYSVRKSFSDYANVPYNGLFFGRCAVYCSEDTSHEPADRYFYCHVETKTWVGEKPLCEAPPLPRCQATTWSRPGVAQLIPVQDLSVVRSVVLSFFLRFAVFFSTLTDPNPFMTGSKSCRACSLPVKGHPGPHGVGKCQVYSPRTRPRSEEEYESLRRDKSVRRSLGDLHRRSRTREFAKDLWSEASDSEKDVKKTVRDLRADDELKKEVDKTIDELLVTLTEQDLPRHSHQSDRDGKAASARTPSRSPPRLKSPPSVRRKDSWPRARDTSFRRDSGRHRGAKSGRRDASSSSECSSPSRSPSPRPRRSHRHRSSPARSPRRAKFPRHRSGPSRSSRRAPRRHRSSLSSSPRRRSRRHHASSSSRSPRRSASRHRSHARSKSRKQVRPVRDRHYRTAGAHQSKHVSSSQSSARSHSEPPVAMTTGLSGTRPRYCGPYQNKTCNHSSDPWDGRWGGRVKHICNMCLLVRNVEAKHPKADCRYNDKSFRDAPGPVTASTHSPVPVLPGDDLISLYNAVASTGVPNYMGARIPTSSGPVPLTQPVFDRAFKTILTRAGLNPSMYSLHSGRRGGATFAFRSDMPCGDFPWNPNYANVLCEYRFERPDDFDFLSDDGTPLKRYNGPFSGRCRISCGSTLSPMPAIGSLANSFDAPDKPYYYCHVDSKKWLGNKPLCEGKGVYRQAHVKNEARMTRFARLPSTVKPCGDFPWETNPDVNVDCDDDYIATWTWPSMVDVQGRCNVSCLNDKMLAGPSVEYEAQTRSSAYYCIANVNRIKFQWDGVEPVCIGGLNNSEVREREANRVRLVGGDFYGCVELYDDVTQQWGPVSGLGFAEYYYTSNRGPLMAWADLVCRDVGFTGGLATHGFLPGESDLTPMSSHFYPSYTRPSDTGPIFFLNTSAPVAEGGVQHLYDTVERVFRGDCSGTQWSADCQLHLMCLACLNELEQKPCGDFPDAWNTSEVTVHCDYNYRETWRDLNVVDVLGRCNVSCRNEKMLVGPSVEHVPLSSTYYCIANNAQWDGVKPVCIGELDNSDVRESKANRVRLVGGEFYGCVELYDDVTQQWGPVSGRGFVEYYWTSNREPLVAWADLVCWDVGFIGALATHGFLPSDSWLTPMSNHFYPSYTRPSDTGPIFFLNTSAPVAEGGVQHLYDTVERVFRGNCSGTQWSADCQLHLMCLACLNELEHKELEALADGLNKALMMRFTRFPSTEKPCGDFPDAWNTSDVKVDCEYDYRETWATPSVVDVLGRCNVSCLNGTMLVGPSHASAEHVAPISYYYCIANNAKWGGVEPVCIGGFDNSVVTESAANRVRLVGGDFYGCVELYDDVTQQWGPVVGFEYMSPGPWDYRMAWADLACRDVGFTGGLDTHAFPKGETWLRSISDQFYTSYSRPSETGPNFFLNTSSVVSAGGVQHLYDTVGRVVRGDCTATESSQDCDRYLMCLACQGQPENFDECTIVSCGVHQRCVNTPGSHVCECMPGYMEVDGGCQAVHTFQSTFRLQAGNLSELLLDYSLEGNSDLVGEVTSTMESLYHQTSLAEDFVGINITDIRPGSVLVDHVINIRASADFSPAMASEELKVLVKEANGTALGIDADQIAITDEYDECSEPEKTDCSPHAAYEYDECSEPEKTDCSPHAAYYDECSEPEKTDCSPHAACLNTIGSFSCSCIMGYQDKSPDVTSRPGRVCEPAVCGAQSDHFVFSAFDMTANRRHT
uniref:Uncharacterized protein n=1 Tax=Branchiostoma floridae TaxID=7739 RepID=C3ZWK0_BRAFL|eukprot:XP_002587058.1 hypothetical protein BRAFLDRAFT_102977 [Branchiostoma floridae]